jgi:hypothetical protein
MNLVCGSAYAVPLRELPTRLYVRLVQRMALLPDRLGPVLSAKGDNLLLLVAACCRLVDLRGPDLPAPLQGRVDEQVRALQKIISRRERKALLSMAPRLLQLNGAAGRELVLGWQQAVALGTARLALALSGSLQGVLEEVSAAPRAPEPRAAALARSLLTFAVSGDLLELRRRLGLDEQEGHRV